MIDCHRGLVRADNCYEMRFIFQQCSIENADWLSIGICCYIRGIENKRTSLWNKQFRERICQFNRIVGSIEFETRKSSSTFNRYDETDLVLPRSNPLHRNHTRDVFVVNCCGKRGYVIQQTMPLNRPGGWKICVNISISHRPKGIKFGVVLRSEDTTVEAGNIVDSNQFCIIK